MKTIIFRISMIAVIAMNLTIWSALATELSIEIYGEAFLYNNDKELTHDVFEAYSVGFKLYQLNIYGADTSQLDDPIEVFFQFRNNDVLIWDDEGAVSGWMKAYSDIYECVESCFEFDIDGFTFTANTIGTTIDDMSVEYNDDYFGVVYSRMPSFDYETIDMYIPGFVNGVPVDFFQIQITNDIDYPEFNWKAFFWIDANLPDPSPIPEPGTLALLGTGLLGALAIARRKKNK